MDITRTEGGALRVLLSDSDLKHFGADFAALGERDPQTGVVIKRILRAVLKKMPLPRDTALTVEAVPTDDGCLLLITPRPRATDNVYTVTVAEKEGLLLLQNTLTRVAADTFTASALYQLPDGYGLLLYYDQPANNVEQLLHEFGKVHTGGIPAAKIAEYGKPLYIGNALERMHHLC